VRNLLFLWTATCGFQPSKGNEKSHYILNIFPFLTKRKECKDDSSKESEGMHQSKQASEPRSSNPCLLDLSFAYTVKVTRQGRAVMHLSHWTPGLCLQVKQCPTVLTSSKGNLILDREGKGNGTDRPLLFLSASNNRCHQGSQASAYPVPHTRTHSKNLCPFSPVHPSDNNPKILPRSLKLHCFKVDVCGNSALRMGVTTLLEMSQVSVWVTLLYCVKDTMATSTFGGGKALFVWHISSEPILEETRAWTEVRRKPGHKLKQRPRMDAAYWLAPQDLLSLLPYTRQKDQLARSSTDHCGLDHPTSIRHQDRTLTCQSYGGLSRLRFALPR
jgi:hypothetical protein